MDSMESSAGAERSYRWPIKNISDPALDVTGPEDRFHCEWGHLGFTSPTIHTATQKPLRWHERNRWRDELYKLTPPTIAKHQNH